MARLFNTILLTGLLLLLSSPLLQANDAPHNETFGISCSSCHGKVLIFHDNDSEKKYMRSPFWGGPKDKDQDASLDEYPINQLCWTCHWATRGYSDTNAPKANTHSCYHYDATGPNDSRRWSWLCIDCHDPHQQQQKNYSGNDMFLATGVIVAYDYDTKTDISILSYDQAGNNEFYSVRPGWEDVDKFSNKTYEMRGAILIPDLEMKNYTYSIVRINRHANEIWVKGNVEKGVYSGGSGPTDPDANNDCPANNPFCENPEGKERPLRYFGITYGQLLKQTINGNPVKFVDKTGPNSFADSDNVYDGVCQVCHTQTAFFRNDSPTFWQDLSPVFNDSLTHPCDNDDLPPTADPVISHTRTYYDDPWHTNCSGISKAETNCAVCHHHEEGFAHRYEKANAYSGFGDTCIACHQTGKHAEHFAGGESCQSCHGPEGARIPGKPFEDPRYKVTGYDDNGNPIYSCDTCHNDGRGGKPNIQDYKDNWDVAGYKLGCDGCHNGRPTQRDPDNEDRLYYAQVNDSCYARTGDEYGCALLNDSCVAATGDTFLCWQPVMTINDSCVRRTGANDSSCNTIKNRVMNTDGHNRLVGEFGIRQYHCTTCHAKTVDENWNLKWRHTDGTADVFMAEEYYLTGTTGLPTYNDSTRTCGNFYCHSDGTKVNPEVRPYDWQNLSRNCDGCHGHQNDPQTCAQCHEDGGRTWNDSEIWHAAMPMYDNGGPGSDRANSHRPHMLREGKSCEMCHYDTIVGACADCHTGNAPAQGSIMTDIDHIKGKAHVNGEKTVVFQRGGSWFPQSKTCVNTWIGNDTVAACHGSNTMVWGGELPAQICYDCHGDVADNDDYGGANNHTAIISLVQWADRGHGRPSSKGDYLHSDNPPANFPANGCWYCHDPGITKHPSKENPFRLRLHQGFANRFEKECNYCHLTANSYECLNCHNDPDLSRYAPQISSINDSHLNQKNSRADLDHAADLASYNSGGDETTCLAACHDTDETRHQIGSEVTWTDADKDDVRNQYLMMGVCLQCHDDDSGGQCTGCHEYGGDNDTVFRLGFDPGLPDTGYIKPQKAVASSAHFGYKHFYVYQTEGKTKGGKFCWDCHDPHGDNNIYMIHDKVTVVSDGKFGKPLLNNDTLEYTLKEVIFTSNNSGSSYAKVESPYTGICQVCHSGTTGGGNDTFVAAHYTDSYGDDHNSGRRCTECHEHRFTDSHSGGKSCSTQDCHNEGRIKPVPRHTAFGLPRDCVKCHKGIRARMDIMGQFGRETQSHHIQRPSGDVKNVDCYPCHWESTEIGLINLDHHTGYNYKTHDGVKNDKIDLVVYGPGKRPQDFVPFNDSTGEGTAVTFLAKSIGNDAERENVENISIHCLSCHSDQNNETRPFFLNDSDSDDDCKTPRHYSWDTTSIAARYLNTDVVTWGKYTEKAYVAKKNVQKAFSAHGNAVANQGGFSPTTGVDGATIPNTRSGARNVQCFDCHSSHGSKVSGTTSSYISFDGDYHGANLKETTSDKGGYNMTYKASANPKPWLVNAYNPGAGQCFDCHETRNSGRFDNDSPPGIPWGFENTFGATEPILGWKENLHFAGNNSQINRFPYRKDGNKKTVGGHLRAETPLTGVDGNSPPDGVIKGLCTPCHDPHGVSPSLGKYMAYAVPLLKGTWLTSPYKEDGPMKENMPTETPGQIKSTWATGYNRYNQLASKRNLHIDRNTFSSSATNFSQYSGETIAENGDRHAGLCLRCHPKASLTDEIDNTGMGNWGTIDRVHETVKGWGTNKEHNFPCSKCHQPHAAGLPRLLTTNCLDITHRGELVRGGVIGQRLWTRGGIGGGQSKYILDLTTTDMDTKNRYPLGQSGGDNNVICHSSPGARNNSGEWWKQEWNYQSAWPNDTVNLYQWPTPVDAVPGTWGWPYK